MLVPIMTAEITYEQCPVQALLQLITTIGIAIQLYQFQGGLYLKQPISHPTNSFKVVSVNVSQILSFTGR